ncbi:MAG TPA: BTAD domain-containing putative transcriptional regulator [Streptosporangiaceae bacterium]|jgi:DNA-binding SARP family transcriptional activator
MAETEFCLLGPLLVRYDGITVPVPPGKQRSLLAALLLKGGRLVPVDELIEALWASAPPPSARASLQTYVMRLRQSLAGTGQSRISTQPDGYLLALGPGELDVDRLELSVAAARQAARLGSWAQADGLLRSGLALWRGEPLADVPSQVLALREKPRLREMWLQAVEARVDADLHLGRHHEVVIELKQLAAEHPLRERLHALLMLALYRDGRQGEALAAYQSARRVLIDELGAEPGAELRELHQWILGADPALTVAGSAGGPGGPGGSGVPRQLPGAAAHFVGRADELAVLDAIADRSLATASTVVISAIAGTAGVGKTALAVHWAHTVAERFPDGQLYINLRGFDPAGPPLDAATAVRRFLEAVGVPPTSIPATVDAQIDLYRSRLADKRMLILLDNARDAGQVRPLLPGAPACLVLVTSRDQLASLVAIEGAHPLPIDLLKHDDSRALLTRRLGARRAAAEPETIEQLISLCARLPLALNIAAAHAVLRPRHPLVALASELGDAQGRLDALASADSIADPRAVFSWSYRTLSTETARMFRLLGVHPGPDISVPAAASLTSLHRDQARCLLEELVGAHLLTEHRPGRYAFHDLLRAYASEQAHAAAPERPDALRRVMDHYLRSATTAATVLRPGFAGSESSQRLDGVIPEDAASQRQAHEWFQAEQAVLVAVIATAADEELNEPAVGIATALSSFLELTKDWADWERTEQTALRSARRSGDLRGEAGACAGLGKLLAIRGSFPEAYARMERARELLNRAGDRPRESTIELSIAIILGMEQRFAEAIGHARRSAELCPTGDRQRQVRILNALGWFNAGLGQLDEALALCRQALSLARAVEDTSSEAATLDSLGYIYQRLGRYDESDAELRRAAGLREALGERFDLAGTLSRLGDTRHAVGDDSALDMWKQAAEIFEDLHHPLARQVREKINAARPDPVLWLRLGSERAELVVRPCLYGGRKLCQGSEHAGAAHVITAGRETDLGAGVTRPA